MRASRRFLQLDVFAHRPGTGNPLAVVIDAQDLDGAAMQALANWTNLSETAFLLPPSRPEASYRVRIFTPRQELPFAGHPSVGSAHAALAAGLVVPEDGRLIQECAAGLLPVRIEGQSASQRVFVRSPQSRMLGAHSDPHAWEGVLDGLALGALPATLIDNGPRWWVVELASEAAVREMTPNLAAIAALTQSTSAVGLAVFAHSSQTDHQLVVRAFCPADGIPEDPVTGSVNAAIGAWLQQNAALRSQRYIASQGREIGRDGKVEVEVDESGDVWIGGQTQTVIEGTLTW